MATRTEPALPSAEDAILAREVSRALERHQDEHAVRLLVDEHTALDLPQSATDLLLEILKQIGAGNAVTLVSLEADVTTQQAADLLNVSRPYLVGLIDNGTLPARMVGNQRRLPLKAVLDYKVDTKAKRRLALDDLSALHQEMGLE
jgi:excisionase family DNA binding protein